MPWIIVNKENEREVWSNSFGWVDEDADFDTFTDQEREMLDLPINGDWRQVAWSANQ